MGRFLACKSLFEQEQMCVTYYTIYANFLGKLLRDLLNEVLIMGFGV